MSDAKYNTYKKVKKYLSEHESEIQHGIGANTFADMAFIAFLQMASRHGVEYSPQFSFIQGDQFTQMTPTEVQNAFSQHIYDLYMEDSWSFDSFMQEHKSISNRIERLYKEFETEIDAKLFEDFVNAHMSWWTIGIIGEDKGRFAHEDLLGALLRKGLTKAEAEESLSILTHLDGISDLMRPQIDELEIRKAIKRGESVDVMIEAYIKKYFFFKTTLRDREVMNGEGLKKEFSQNVVSHEEQKEKDFKRQQDLLYKKLHFSVQELKRIDYLKKMVVWVDERRATYMEHNYYFFEALHRIANEFAIPYDTLIMYSLDEVIDLLKTRKPLSEDEIKQRNNGFFLVYEVGQPRKYFYGDEAKELVAIARKPANESHVEGIVASRGEGNVVTGKSRLIQNENDSLLEDGEVLVTSMTRPEFVKYMKNAAAIVTDEGGIACHAAIVSREMGKLCVIGTKHATQIFKDGDMVEVNPKTGVVKIIN